MLTRLRPVYLTIIAVLLFISNQAQANRCETLFFDKALHSDRVPIIPTAQNGPGFIVPNEKNIGAVRETFAKAVPGIYATVGTERGFMGAALTGRATKALVLIDRDPKVLLFNLVNKSLLELSESREDYLDLRLRASFETIAKRATESAELSAESREILSSIETWTWWNRNVRQTDGWREFHDSSQPAYKDANYLFNDVLFDSISNLAKQGRIFVYNTDLKGGDARLKLVGLARVLKSQLAVFDVSNAWDVGYLGPQVTIGIINSLKDITGPKTQFVFTYLAASSDARDTQATFMYWVIRKEQIAGPDELAQLLGGLMRREPSRSTGPSRSRSTRIRFDD